MSTYKHNKTRNSLSLRVHYTVSDTTHATRHQIASSVCRWPIAAGKRPDPFRTRKLSLLTLMVLQPGGCGRVRNRRHQTTNHNSIHNKERPLKHYYRFNGLFLRFQGPPPTTLGERPQISLSTTPRSITLWHYLFVTFGAFSSR